MGAALRDKGNFACVDVDHVDERQMIAQHPQIGQPLQRALALVGEIPFRIARRRGHVRGDVQAPLARNGAGRLPQRGGVGHVPDQQRPGRDQAPVIGQGGQIGLDGGNRLVGQRGLVIIGRKGAVHAPAPDPPANAHRFECGGHFVEGQDRARLQKRGRPGLEHGERGEPGGQRLLARGMPVIERDHPLVEPFVERQVFGQEIAQQSLGQVDMAVDEAGRADKAAPVDHLARADLRLDLVTRPHRHDAPARHGQRPVADHPPRGIHGDEHRPRNERVRLDHLHSGPLHLSRTGRPKCRPSSRCR